MKLKKEDIVGLLEVLVETEDSDIDQQLKAIELLCLVQGWIKPGSVEVYQRTPRPF